MDLLARLALRHPIVQAPMAGSSTPALAAAVSEAGGLGSIAVGATDAAGAGAMIAQVRARTGRAFNLNLFAHRPARADPARETAWLAALAPEFARFDAAPPATLREIYASALIDEAMLAAVVAAAPAMVSFHFGLPGEAMVRALRGAGCLLVATVTSLAEAAAAHTAGIDALVAQGIEAGGHRGVFDEHGRDEGLGTLALTRLLVVRGELPVIAAGGIMDGRGIAAALALGAVAAQLGTAFLLCPESATPPAHRAALVAPDATTVMTRAISGRPARCLANAFTAWEAAHPDLAAPDYPIAYDAGKALAAAASAAGEPGYGAQWAGQGVALARAMPAADLVATLAAELSAA